MEKIKGDGFAIPKLFWDTMPDCEFEALLGEQDCYLNQEQCARLWRMTERNTTPPRRLLVLVKELIQ